jgi:hypothetical protein
MPHLLEPLPELASWQEVFHHGAYDLLPYVGRGQALPYIKHAQRQQPELLMFSMKDELRRPQSKLLVVPEGSHYYVLNLGDEGPCAVRFFGATLHQPYEAGMTDLHAITNDRVEFAPESHFNQPNWSYRLDMFNSQIGVSKVGIIDGNGKVLSIDCDFMGPANHILMKSLEHGRWHMLRRIKDQYIDVSDGTARVNPAVFATQHGFGIYNDVMTEVNLPSTRYVFLALRGKDEA